ncbi:hypothetical protein HispidOSU_023634 [Sigmodon hispidus]
MSCSPSPGVTVVSSGVPNSGLSILAMPVKVSVEIADLFVMFVKVVSKHSASNHFPLSDAALQLISSPASKPYGALDQFFRVLFKVPEDPMLSYTPNRALFSFQRSTTLGGGSVSLTWVNSGPPREKLLHTKGIQLQRLLLATQGRLPAISAVHLNRAPDQPEKWEFQTQIIDFKDKTRDTV